MNINTYVYMKLSSLTDLIKCKLYLHYTSLANYVVYNCKTIHRLIVYI